MIQNERAQLQLDRIRNHAQTTQELYDDIHRTLKEKFTLEQKAKLGEITGKLTKSFQEKILKLENIKEKELAQERKRVAQTELKVAQQDNTVYNQTQKITKMEAELQKNKTIQQQLTNLQPMKGTDGNCKRCEALIFMNGSYIEKIKKLKKQVSLKNK